MRVLFVLGLTALAACNNGGDTDTTPDCSEVQEINGECGSTTDDTGTQPSSKGSFTAPMVDVVGASESCTSNLISESDDYTVASGETKEVGATSYDLTFGDMSLATEFSDFLPIHTAGDGGQWITPSQQLVVGEGKTATADPPVMSRYVGGQTWTCSDAESTDENDSETDIVAYYDTDSGLTITLPMLGSEAMHGLTFGTATTDCATVEGEFISLTQAVRDVWCHYEDLGDVEQHTQCWQGEFSDRPVTW